MHELKKKKGYVPPIEQEVLDAIEWKWQNVPYAHQSAQQVLDIYYPNQVILEQYPVIVYYHGGGFELGAKDDEDLEPMLCALDRGYVVVSVEYRKSAEARFPAALYDAKAALRFLRANARRYRLDAERIGVWGPSSGGWIVAMLGVTDGNPAFEDLSMGNEEYSSGVDAVLDWCGPCAGFHRMDQMAREAGMEVRRPHSDPKSPESKFLGADITLVPELCELACPCTYANADIPPFMIVHGTADNAVPVRQSIEFAGALRSKAGDDKVRLYIAEGAPHHGNTWYTQEWVINMCLDFFDGVLKAGESLQEEMPLAAANA